MIVSATFKTKQNKKQKTDAPKVCARAKNQYDPVPVSHPLFTPDTPTGTETDVPPPGAEMSAAQSLENTFVKTFRQPHDRMQSTVYGY